MIVDIWSAENAAIPGSGDFGWAGRSATAGEPIGGRWSRSDVPYLIDVLGVPPETRPT